MVLAPFQHFGAGRPDVFNGIAYSCGGSAMSIGPGPGFGDGQPCDGGESQRVMRGCSRSAKEPHVKIQAWSRS